MKFQLSDFEKQLMDPTIKTVSSMRWAFVRGNQATWAIVGAFILVALIMVGGTVHKGTSYTELGNGLQGVGIAFASVLGALQVALQAGKGFSKASEIKQDSAAVVNTSTGVSADTTK